VTENAEAGADALVWIDLEMTGLVVERDTIVEIACIITTADLTAVDEGVQLVVHQPPEALTVMDDFVTNMHRRSGLLDEISASSTDVATAEARVLEYVKGHIPAQGVAPLCGNSIGMDRRFIARYMPALDGHLHYRSIDVSSIKELCRRWYPTVYRRRPGKSEQHRALDDVRESISEMRFYRDELFIRPATDPSPSS
jgi:oligoribonuclease